MEPVTPSPRSSWALLRDFARLLLLAVVLPALLLSAVMLWLSARNHQEEMRDRLNAAAEASAHNMDGILRAHLAVIQVLAERRSDTGDAADVAAWTADLARVHRHFPAFRSVFATDAQGRVLAADPPTLRAEAPKSIAFRPHFRRVRSTGKPVVSDVFRARLFSTEPRVSTVAPVFAHGRFAGTVVGSLGAEAFAGDQSHWLRSRGMELLVIDRGGTVVHASDGLDLGPLERPLRSPAWLALDRHIAKSVVLLPGVLRGGGAAYAHAERLSTGWQVVVLMPVATLEALQRRDATAVLGLLAVIVAGVLVIVWLRSRQQAASVHALLRRMQQFALGGSIEDVHAVQDVPQELAPLWAALAQLSARVGEAYAETSRGLQEQSRLREELQDAAHRLMSAQEQERHALSRELHDDIGQSITAMKLGAMALAHEDAEGQRAIAAEIMATADQTITKLRNLSLLLRPPQLDALGLEAALQGQVDLLSRNAQARIRLCFEPLPMRPSPDVELACFRIAQEAITNALRHADARDILVSVSPRDGGVALEVRDDGAGVAPGARAGFGLVTMRERAQQAGGRFELESTPGHGSTVRAWMPLEG